MHSGTLTWQWRIPPLCRTTCSHSLALSILESSMNSSYSWRNSTEPSFAKVRRKARNKTPRNSHEIWWCKDVELTGL